MKGKKGAPECASCGKHIGSRKDLVVVSELNHFPLAAYHASCYVGRLKRSIWTYGGTRPLNGSAGTIATGVTAFFSLAFAVLMAWLYSLSGIGTILLFALLLGLWAAVSVAVRWWVYTRYERPLPE